MRRRPAGPVGLVATQAGVAAVENLVSTAMKLPVCWLYAAPPEPLVVGATASVSLTVQSTLARPPPWYVSEREMVVAALITTDALPFRDTTPVAGLILPVSGRVPVLVTSKVPTEEDRSKAPKSTVLAGTVPFRDTFSEELGHEKVPSVAMATVPTGSGPGDAA
jgi:hypothetical protein